MHRRTSLALAAAAALTALGLMSCAADGPQTSQGALRVGDFVFPATAPAARSATSAIEPVDPPAAPPDTRPSPPATAPAAAAAAPVIPVPAASAPASVVVAVRRTDNAYSVDGMIGQVNGQALYAAKLLDPLDAQLSRLGSDPDIPRIEFRFQASRLFHAELEGKVYETLALGEARRDLTEGERDFVEQRVNEKREELIRKWGSGSPILADSQLREGKEGRSLDQMLEDYRQRLIIGRYIHMKVLIKINISRRDIERYYYTHPDEFNPKPGRVFRIINCTDPDDADKIDRLLHAGKSFIQVASSELNQSSHRDEGGLYSKEPLVGKLGVEPLSDALMKLKVGEASPRIAVGRVFYWLYLDSMSAGHSRPLREVQQDIEDLLTNQAFKREENANKERLMTEPVYSAIEEMTSSMVDIAMCRYARPD
jgi:hypothetical protein